MHSNPTFRKFLARDSTIIPAVCYDICNNCYIEAQKTGLSPELCVSGSAFEQAYASCQACVAAHGDPSGVSLQTYVEPEFAPFINFCNAEPAQASSISAIYYATITQNNTVYVTLPASPTGIGLGSQSGPPPHRNYAWVAGLLVGLLFLAAATVCCFLYFRKRRKTNERQNVAEVPVEVDTQKEDPDLFYKAQLHADSITMLRYELSSGTDTKRTSELPVLEPVGSELQGKWLHGEPNELPT